MCFRYSSCSLLVFTNNLCFMELILKDIMRFYCCSEKVAIQRKKEICSFFEIPFRGRRILDIHIAKYEGLSVSDVRTILLD